MCEGEEVLGGLRGGEVVLRHAAFEGRAAQRVHHGLQSVLVALVLVLKHEAGREGSARSREHLCAVMSPTPLMEGA